MIARLRGKVVQNDGEQIVLDVSGVGYLITVSEQVHHNLPSESANDDTEVELIVHTDVKETDISLFGFANELERQVFLLLKKVKGIGSRLALTIVSAMGSEELLSLISSRDIAALQRIPGIGKKTAERVIVELREQVGQLAFAVAPLVGQIEISRQADLAFPAGPQTDALLALQKLGFPEERARRAIDQVVQDAGEENNLDASQLLQNALTHIAV